MTLDLRRPERTFTIRNLCVEFRVTPRALRFYEDKGLLSPAREGLNRVYNHRDRARLQLADECGDAARVFAFVCDVGDEAQVDNTFAASVAALELTRDNRASAAEILGLSRQSLYVKLRRYGLGDLGPGVDK